MPPEEVIVEMDVEPVSIWVDAVDDILPVESFGVLSVEGKAVDVRLCMPSVMVSPAISDVELAVLVSKTEVPSDVKSGPTLVGVVGLSVVSTVVADAVVVFST